MTELPTGVILQAVLDGMKVLVESTDSKSYKPRNPYAAAVLGSVCIELMGRCMHDGDDWMSDALDATGQFNKALTLDGLSNYKDLEGLWKYDKTDDSRLDNHRKKILNSEPIMSKNAEYLAAKKEANEKYSESKSASNKRDVLYEELNNLRLQAGIPSFDKGFSLFKALRCGFSHTCRPQSRLLLTDSIDENGGVQNTGKYVVLGVKQLYQNLVKAQNDLKSKGGHYDETFVYVSEIK